MEVKLFKEQFNDSFWEDYSCVGRWLVTSIICVSMIYVNIWFLGKWENEGKCFQDFNKSWKHLKSILTEFKNTSEKGSNIFIANINLIYDIDILECCLLGKQRRSSFIYEEADKILNVGIKRQTSGKRFKPHTLQMRICWLLNVREIRACGKFPVT